MVGLAVILIIAIVVAPIVSLVWVWRLSGQVAELRARLGRIEGGVVAPSPVAPSSEISDDVPEDSTNVIIAQPEPETPPDEIMAVPPDVAASIPPDREEPRTGGRSWEEMVASSWMVWLGGLTVALAAVFFFRFAIDQGYLTPLTRVVLGLIGGGLLLSAGEWVLRRPIGANSVVKTDYVPPALTAAGLFAIFVSLFAAHSLYGLIGSSAAFIALGLTAYAAIGLALRQGWFVALLGILGGYVVPALIDSPDANAPALFIYLFALTLAALAVMVWRRWRWFSILAIAGALFWPWLWMMSADAVADQGVLGAYLLGLSAAFAVLSSRLPVFPQERSLLNWIGSVLTFSSGIGFALSGLLLIILSVETGFNAASFALLAIHVGLSLALGMWRSDLESLPAIAALIVLATALIWPEPTSISLPERAQEIGRSPVANAFGPFVMPPEFHAFSRGLWAFAALFGLGGYLGLGRVTARILWAGLSAGMPVVLFAIDYWRIGGFEVDISWAYWAMGLAAIMVLAAVHIRRSMPHETGDLPLALYAAAATASIALAFACLLREAWLTVALGAEVAALAWIWKQLRVEALKAVAVAVAAIVVVRLVGNPRVIDYQGTLLGTFGWVVYGYGLPAVAIGWASHVFARDGRDTVVTLCEIAAAGLGSLLVAAQLKLWTSGTLDTGRWDFLDLAVQSAWWLTAGGIVLYRPFAEDRAWARIAGLVAIAFGAHMLVTGTLLSANPLFSREYVGTWPLVNLLSVAYLVPAILFGLFALSRRFVVPDAARGFMAVAAGLLVFIDVTMEVRRAFWGNDMMLGLGTLPTNGEVYAYSAVWTLFALSLLALGIVVKSPGLRYASLAVLLITVAKLFLYDMSDLTGLYRVASFLGLGLTLIGIGRIYQKFVLPGGQEKDADPAS